MDLTHDRSEFYKYVPADGCIKILETCSLKWTCPLAFNDLFDVKTTVDYGFDLEELRPLLRDEYERVFFGEADLAHYCSPRARVLIQIMRSKSTDPAMRVWWQTRRDALVDDAILRLQSLQAEQSAQWRENVRSLRVLCLSELPDSSVMWSQYADSHRGAVVTLRCVKEIDSAWLAAVPVDYSASGHFVLSKADWARHLTGQIPFPTGVWFRATLCRKSPEWGYEREWRVINREDRPDGRDYSIRPIDPREIQSVVLGARMTREVEGRIRSLLRERLAHVQVLRAVPNLITQRVEISREDVVQE